VKCLALVFLAAAGSAASAYPFTVITCKGMTTFADGTISGHGSVTLAQAEDDQWYLDLGSFAIPAGKNRSADPDRVLLKAYRWYSRYGVDADYNYRDRTLRFRYKYNSGILGGGTQKTRGTFTDCEVTMDEKPMTASGSCGEELRAWREQAIRSSQNSVKRDGS
jgi:hypothetical protein